MEIKNYPLISVVIPTYKRAAFLKKAVDSVLNQNYPNYEVIVVDDNDPFSKERVQTERVMHEYLDIEKVHYIKHSENRNGAAARNTGIQHSQGEYICFLDDDDWYYENKLMLQYEYLRVHPEFDAVYCGWKREGKIQLPEKTGDLTFELLSGISLIYTNTLMVKKEKILVSGGWNEEFRRNQEAVFLLRLFKAGVQIGVVSECLVEFDTSDRQNMSNPIQHHQDFLQFLNCHQEQIKDCKRYFTDARERIYSYRYREIFLTYLKYGYRKEAIVFFVQAAKELTHHFVKDCFTYGYRKICGIPLYNEYADSVCYLSNNKEIRK